MSSCLNTACRLWFLTCCLYGCGSSADGSSPPPGSHSGLRTQGKKMQGTSLQRIQLRSATVGSAPITGLTLQGTSFSGQGSGRTLSGMDFVGAQFQAFDAAGDPRQITIQSITGDSLDPSGETLLYRLVITDVASGVSQNACEADADGVQLAIPVPGIWSASGAHLDSATEFTFGCTSGVIAKCVRWGYRPWQRFGTEPLAPYHQICTRLARADYCGDGQTHTQEGTLVDVYDDQQLLTPVPNSGLIFDAAWTEDGAYCIEKQRWIELQSLPTFKCAADFVNLDAIAPDPAQRASPVNPEDRCLVRRSSLARDAVHIDNRSGLNAAVL